MAQIWEYIKIALMNIKSNKGRSFLTMLGIIIGISSVIMIISIGNGIKGGINTELDALAGGQIYVYSNPKNESQIQVSFTEDDIEAVRSKVEHVEGVTPIWYVEGTTGGRSEQLSTSIQMGMPDLQLSKKDPIIKGRYFSDSDYYSANRVCVITETSAKNLFGTTNVVGMSMDVTVFGVTQEFTVVGIRKDPATSALLGGLLGTSSKVNMEIPLSVGEAGFGFEITINDLMIMSDGTEHSAQVAREAVSLLEGRHNVRGKDAISLQNFTDSMTQINQVLGYITAFVVLVAAISLLVGGIGVMNIMLVSVTERTREIGIRKALGARTGSILLQFLFESAIITFMGGIIGIVIGVGSAYLVCAALKTAAKVTISTVVGASFFSSAVGLFFGIYPARKAARLSPIEALRHE